MLQSHKRFSDRKKLPSPFLSSFNNMTFVINQQVLSNSYSFFPLGSLVLNKPCSSSLETESLKHVACSLVFQSAQRCFLCYVFFIGLTTTFPRAIQKILIIDDGGMVTSFHWPNYKHNYQNYYSPYFYLAAWAVVQLPQVPLGWIKCCQSGSKVCASFWKKTRLCSGCKVR